MVETFTPAVCGSRARQITGLAVFALAAMIAAAALGALLGVAGAEIGRPAALALAVAAAVAAAAREAGVLRFPLPQARRQVPERWRSTLPLPVWSAGYGAGLGAGVFTHQPVATFWAACAGALALGRPLACAAAFALYGFGRALVLLLPARRGADATAIVERLAVRRRTVLRVNVVALAVCAVLLALSPTASAAVMHLGTGSELDPSASEGTFAFTRRIVGATPQKKVVVAPESGQRKYFANAELPSLDGGRLAFVTDHDGILVVNWATKATLAQVPADSATKPALDWPWLAFRRTVGSDHDRRYSLRLRNLETGKTRYLMHVPAPTSDLGRPSIAGDRVVWHLANRRGSSIFMYRISRGKRAVLSHTDIWLLENPAVSLRSLVWVRQVRNVSTFYRRRLGSSRVTVLARESGDRYAFWTSDTAARKAYVTRWSLSTGAAGILRFGF